MIICIDGNDGTGKTTLIEQLKCHRPHHVYHDRGLPTRLTDNISAKAGVPVDLYIILSCPPDVSERRLKEAGKNMEEPWHTPSLLNRYHNRFIKVARENGWLMLDADRPPDKVLEDVLRILDSQPKIQ